ncbi:hypothetical protein ACQBAU_02715 [Propionibacteriaceae bacterium Y2011]
MRHFLRTLLACASVFGLLASAHVLFRAYGPPPDADDIRSLTRSLEAAIADGADREAQALFPEGAFFMHVLTGIAQARSADPEGLELARQHLRQTRNPEMLARFGSGMSPEHGIFAAGWSLLLAQEISGRTGDAADLTATAELANEVGNALAQSPTPFLASYPGQYWPCDTIVAAAALHLAADRHGNDPAAARWSAVVDDWERQLRDVADPDTQLLPHRTDATGQPLEGPRGSSQAIIQTFLPEITGTPGGPAWTLFRDAFVSRQAGLVGIREYPIGESGAGDVDSGPLVLGVSLSASAVALAAARRNGDAVLADGLAAEQEVFGVSTPIPDRHYALGLVPIGEAFIAFANSHALTEPVADAPPTTLGRPWWPIFWLPGLLIAAAGAIGLWRLRGPARDRPTAAA